MLHPVFDGIKVPAWDGDANNVMDFEALSLEELLQREFPFDAFTVGYGVITPEGTDLGRVPRLTNKISRKGIADIRAEGGDIYMSAAFIDLDRQPHDPWPAEDMDKVRGYIEDLAVLLPEGVIYATKRGIRVIFKFRRLVAIEDYRKIARAAMLYVEGAVKRIGVPVTMDPSAEEWDRLARLPYVTRGGQKTAATTFMHVPEVWVGWFPGHSMVAEVEREVERIAATYEGGSRPTGVPDFSEQTEAMIQDIAFLGPPYLRGVANALLAGDPYYKPGERNTRTWEVMRGLYNFMRVKRCLPTPEEIYGLFYPSVMKSSGTNPEEALEETWGMAQRLYARQLAAQEVDLRERTTALEAAKDRTPAVVYMNKGRWIWNPETKTFGQATTDKDTFMADISRLHPLISLDDKGKVLPQSVILREQGIRVHGIKLVVGQRGSRIAKDANGRTWLEVGIGELTPVNPVFHEECQQYLDLIVKGAGEEDGRLFLEWLSTCTRLTEPTVALVLRGASGAGKDMLAETLARLFGGKASFRKSMDRFNSQMLDAALIHLNEGMDDKEKGGAVANRFREIVAGGTVDIESKGVDAVMVTGNYRVVITANNPQPLPVQNTKTLEDFRAIANRVLHVYVSQEVADWLEAKGGRDFTRDWVDRDMLDHKEPGKLAEHLSWLMENYEVRRHNSRFLVPANVGNWHVRSLLQGVLRDILYAAGKAATTDAYERSVRVADGKVWVTDDSTFVGIVNQINHTNYEVREIKDSIRGGLVDGKPRRFSVQGASKIFYPMPMDLLIPLMKPEDPDIYIEEQEDFELLSKLVADLPEEM